MPLQLSDIQRIAKLSHLEISASTQTQILGQLNGFFAIVERIQSVDTTDIEPLAHPTAVLQAVQLRLEKDSAQAMPALETAMQNAPAQASGVFLVPRVIE
jgi:aspartyl-tRNA(Asn)/glutamyl-tRNA(Gln) amidotransferase subunit C